MPLFFPMATGHLSLGGKKWSDLSGHTDVSRSINSPPPPPPKKLIAGTDLRQRASRIAQVMCVPAVDFSVGCDLGAKAPRPLRGAGGVDNTDMKECGVVVKLFFFSPFQYSCGLQTYVHFRNTKYEPSQSKGCWITPIRPKLGPPPQVKLVCLKMGLSQNRRTHAKWVISLWFP